MEPHLGCVSEIPRARATSSTPPVDVLEHDHRPHPDGQSTDRLTQGPAQIGHLADPLGLAERVRVGDREPRRVGTRDEPPLGVSGSKRR